MASDTQEIVAALRRANARSEEWLMRYAVCSGGDWDKYRAERKRDLALLRRLAERMSGTRIDAVGQPGNSTRVLVIPWPDDDPQAGGGK